MTPELIDEILTESRKKKDVNRRRSGTVYFDD